MGHHPVRGDRLHLQHGLRPGGGAGFLRRSAFRRSYGKARYSPRPQGLAGVRKLFFEGTADYYHDTTGRLESRELEGEFRVEFTSTDQLTVGYSASLERIDQPFEVANGVSVPAGLYEFRQGQVDLMLSPSRPVSGFVSPSHGEFYGGTITEASWRGRVEFRRGSTPNHVRRSAVCQARLAPAATMCWDPA